MSLVDKLKHLKWHESKWKEDGCDWMIKPVGFHPRYGDRCVIETNDGDLYITTYGDINHGYVSGFIVEEGLGFCIAFGYDEIKQWAILKRAEEDEDGIHSEGEA